MSEFNLIMNCGLGDIITAWAVLNSIKHNYEKVYVDARLDLIDAWRPGCVDHEKFILELIHFLFGNDEKYVLFEKKSINTCHDLIRDGVVKPVIPKCDLMLGIPHQLQLHEPYIVITTKVREIACTKYAEIKDVFINILKGLSKKYKIVVIGERIIEDTIENRILQTSVFSIYNDVIKNVENVIDLTEETMASKENPPSLEKIRKDCDLINKANCAITLGCGGNLALALMSAKKLIGFRWDCYEKVDYNNLDPNITCTFNTNEFLNKLRSL